jgi:hypothetical protein
LNPGFEDVQNGFPAGWTFISGQVQSSSEQAHTGTYSVKIADDPIGRKMINWGKAHRNL